MQSMKRVVGMVLALLLLVNVTAVSAAEPISEVRDLIENYYIEELPKADLEKPTIKEIMEGLDPYSVYMSAREFANFTNGIEQRIYGIGVVLEDDANGIRVIAVIPDGPADRAGIKPGDLLIHANGRSLIGESVQTTVTIISGEANTPVFLTFITADTKETVTKIITREFIQLPNVESKMLGGDIGYIRLNSFSEEAPQEIMLALGKLQGAKSWILDLRNNGGGYVSAAQEVLGLFPNVKNAFQLRYKNGQPEIYAAIPQKVKFTGKPHILINEHSASASEMVAVSTKEQEVAVLYGQTSFGKGSMQSLFPLSDKSLLKLTTAHYYSPKGQAVHGLGVRPHVETAAGEELIQSHKDQLVAQLKNYVQYPTLSNVPVTKTFTVEMNMAMDWSNLNSANIELIQLGGKEVQIEVKPLSEKAMEIKPKEKLQPNETYMLIIHPNWKSKQHKKMNAGIYLEVTVK